MIYRFDVIPPNHCRFCVWEIDDSNLYGSAKDQDSQGNLEGEHTRYQDLPN